MSISLSKTYMIKSYNGNGPCLSLINGTASVSNGKRVQLKAEDNTSAAQHWAVKNVSATRRIVSSINNSYALNYNATDSLRRCEIYTYTDSSADTALTIEYISTSENTCRT